MSDKTRPLYQRIKSSIRTEIKEGKWSEGEQLPVEKDLCEIYKTSRTTIRLALMKLEQEGIIQILQGKGTFVLPNKIEYQFFNTLSFSENMSRRGFSTSYKILSVQVIPARGKPAEQLKAEISEPIVRIHRVRFVENEPLLIATSFLKWKTAPNLVEDISKENIPSLFAYLYEKENIEVIKSNDSFEPVLLDSEQAKILNVNENSLGLSIESTTFNKSDEPVEYSLTYVRGDTCKIYVEYVRQQYP